MIEMRRAQLSFGDGLIAEEVSDLREGWMEPADRVLADEQIVAAVYEALARRHPKSRSRGRLGAPAEMVLRLLILKHIRNWSYGVLEREVPHLHNKLTWQRAADPALRAEYDTKAREVGPGRSRAGGSPQRGAETTPARRLERDVGHRPRDRGIPGAARRGAGRCRPLTLVRSGPAVRVFPRDSIDGAGRKSVSVTAC